MSTDWQLIYRSYDADELAAEIVALKAQKTLYSQQSVGNQSGIKDLKELRDQLAAAVMVQNEHRGACRRGDTGVLDFSRIQL